MLSEMEKIIAEALIADGKLTQSDLDEWLAAAGNEDQSIEDLLMKNRTAAGSTIRRIRERGEGSDMVCDLGLLSGSDHKKTIESGP